MMAEWKDGIAKISLPTPFPVGDVNVYVIKGDRLTLVDVGPKTEEAWMKLRTELKDLKLKPEDIEQVVLTHHHPDHAGLLDYFPKNLDVYAHPDNERWLSMEVLDEQEDFYKKIMVEFDLPEKFFPFLKSFTSGIKYGCHRPLTGYLHEKDVPLGLPEWTVIETHGHAQGHIGLYREKDGIYIGGDHLLAHISSNPTLEPPLPGKTERPKPQLQYNEALRKLLEIPMSLVYTGHGTEIKEKDRLIHKRLNEQHERAMKVKKWLEDKTLTIFEACRLLFPTVYKTQLGLVLSETVAQFDYLLDKNEIGLMMEDGVARYYAG